MESEQRWWRSGVRRVRWHLTSRRQALETAHAAVQQLRQAESDSQRDAALLSAVLDSIGDGVGVVDRNGRFLLHNKAAKALLGIDEDAEHPGQWQQHYGIFRPDGVTPFPDQELPLMRALAGETTHMVDMFIRNAGHPEGVMISVSGRPLEEAASGVSGGGAVAVFHDVTEVRRWELALAERAGQLQDANRRLQQAQAAAEAASQAKSQFLQSMSHEIRTPLNGVLGFTALLAQTPDHPEAAQWARWADTSGRVLLDLVNNGLDLAKIEAGGVTLEDVEFNLPELAQEALLPSRLGARETGLELRLEVGEGFAAVRRGDPTRVRQVLTNLVANAVKFTPSGSVTLAIAATGPTGSEVRIQVTDTGIGMTPEQRERLFIPFLQGAADTTRRYGGTGLGLFITLGLVEAMHGSIEVTSEPGSGSTFSVVLPLPPATPAGAMHRLPQQRSETPANQAALRVLVAEDNPTNQLVARAMLQARGLEVELVEDGEQAVAAALTRQYDAIFMDCQMPGVDGFEATRRIRAAETGPAVTIIAMTANAFEEDRRACLEAGMNDFLPKPWKAAQLTEVLERLTTQVPSS